MWHICHWASEGKIKSAILPKKCCSIQTGVRIANNWKKNNYWLLSFPKVTDILQKEKHVYPTVFSDADRMLRSVQYIIPAMGENSSRNSISPPNKIVNGLIQADFHLQMAANDGNWKTHDPQSQNMRETEECLPHSHARTQHFVAQHSLPF